MTNRRHQLLLYMMITILVMSLPFDVRGAQNGPEEVLIYYANETAPNENEQKNYETIINWLRETGEDEFIELSRQYERDMHLFPAVVDLEVDIIQHRLPRRDGRLNGVIITNRMAREGRFLIYRAGYTQFRNMCLAIPCFDNYIHASNPLCQSAILRRVLEKVATIFSADDHEFIFVVKSHGSKERFLTPLISVRHQNTNRDEVLALASHQVDEANLPDWVHRSGITKSEFFSIVSNVGDKYDMTFSSIVIEACQGGISPSLEKSIPMNIQQLSFIDGNANHLNLIWDNLLHAQSKHERFADTLTQRLPPIFDTVSTRSNPKRSQSEISRKQDEHIPYLLYYFPLVGWFGYVAGRWFKKGSSAGTH